MSSKAARREYLKALADFERGCAEFSQRMATIFDPLPPGSQPILSPFGPRKPAKRASRRTSGDSAHRRVG
ncbi:hypothetical protein QTI33_32130 [Variovorax sp. J22P271]|uniref:hypothetical protein n=1 Tax=Variovorax davisae TaxID=3053515 RepID=UPI00257705FF|nr:hypothetical protein [Variovorax sp. J22P271]MDM0036822.1 hypothetical protein [Variovorax sp. J22P271]